MTSPICIIVGSDFVNGLFETFEYSATFTVDRNFDKNLQEVSEKHVLKRPSAILNFDLVELANVDTGMAKVFTSEDVLRLDALTHSQS